MRLTRFALIAAIAMGLTLFGGAARAGSKNASYKAQMSHTFANVEQAPAHGLVVALSGPAEVVTEASTGAAGPFRNVSGNGTAQITLTNVTAPIEPAGGENSSVSLAFRSPKSKLMIKSWWWLDENGKRLGKKQKG